MQETTGKVLRSNTAWSLIGWDDGPIRIKGGRTIYEAVMFSDGGRQKMVLLAYLVPTERGIKQVNRYVPIDTVIEVMEPVKAEENN